MTAGASRLLSYLIAFNVAFLVMSLDIYVPSLPAMVDYFGSTEEMLQLTISMGCFGSALGSPFIGPLADSYGRRNSLLGAMILFLLSTTACMLAPTLDVLIAARFFQGISVAAGPIIGMAMIADLYRGEDFSKVAAMIGVVITFSLACAPIIGGHIGAHFGWKAIFLFVALSNSLVTVWLLSKLPETLKEKRPLSIAQGLRDYGSMLKNWTFMGYGLLPALSIGALISYVGVASYYFIDRLGIPQDTFGYYQGAGMFVHALGALAVNRWVVRFGNGRMLKVGMSLIFLSVLIFVFIGFTYPTAPMMITLPFMIFNFGLALVFSPATERSLGLFLNAAGTASAMLSSLRMLVSSIVVYIMGLTYDGTLSSIVFTFSTTALIGVAIFLMLLIRGKNGASKSSSLAKN